MEEVTALLEKISLTNFDPGSRRYVHITHIIDPSNFYIRPTTYDTYLDGVSAKGNNIQLSDINIGSVVVFKSRQLKTYTRGRVQARDNQDATKFDLFAIDEGFIEKSVKLKNIYRTMYRNAIPPLAVHCQLSRCVPVQGDWTNREIDAMKTYVGKEKALMVVEENVAGTLVVVLINSSPDDIGTLMALTGYACMGIKRNEVGRFTVPKAARLCFKYKDLIVGNVLKVRFQHGNELSKFFVADRQDYKEFLKEQDNYSYFTRQLKELKSEDLKEDLPVGVRVFPNKYERGIIREVPSPNRAKVQLIDWGIEKEYHVALLKPMSEKFFHIPAIAIYCTLKNEELCDHRFDRYCYPGYEFLIEIIEPGDSLLKPNVVKILPNLPMRKR